MSDEEQRLLLLLLLLFYTKNIYFQVKVNAISLCDENDRACKVIQNYIQLLYEYCCKNAAV